MVSASSMRLLAVLVGLCSVVAGSDLVKVDVYIEALCPYCAKFSAEILGSIFKNEVANITEINLVPYGNAMPDGKGELKCQHGPEECQLNRVIACAISLKPNQFDWYPFVGCIEGQFPAEAEAIDGCAKKAGISLEDLKSCATGDKGDELIRAAAQETNALDPPHQYVPWIVVNGVPLGGNYAALQSVICAAYIGPRPKACFSVPAALGVSASSSGDSSLHLS